MTRFYLAARYSRRDVVRELIPEFRLVGLDLQARWLHGTHTIAPGADEAEANAEGERFARDDYEDVTAARFMVAYNPEEDHRTGRGGRHVELGIALAQAKPVFLAGRRENIFRWHVGVMFLGNVPLHELPVLLAPFAHELGLPQG